MNKGEKGFKKGDLDAGSKPGANNKHKNKLWKETLNRAVLAKDGEALRRIADALIDKAGQGDVAAIKELGDRIDGKVINEIDMNGNVDLVVELVRWEDD
mgnify:CR=1 FL=1